MEVKTEIFLKRKLAAAFFIPKENNINQPMELLLKKAGATQISPPEKDDWAWYCHWAGMICDASIHNELESYQLFVIQFLQSVFHEGISDEDNDLPIEKDGNLHLALAFRDACEALQPEVAYIATRLPYGEFEKIVKNVELIETYDPDKILSNAGLIYLKGIIADWLTYPRPQFPQDSLPVKEGLLVFSGIGRERWW